MFRTLSNICSGAFCSKTCVTLAYLEPYRIQNLRNIWNPVKHLWCSIFLETLCNSAIFKILVYLEFEKYSEQDKVFYSEPLVTITYLNS